MATSQEILDVLVRMRGSTEFARDANKAATGVKKVGGSAKEAAYGTERLNLGVGRLRTHLTFLGRSALTVAGVAGIGGLIEAGHEAVNAFKAQQVAAAQTRAVIHSTGGAANINARQVRELAGSLAELAGGQKANVQEGLNQLLMFRHIHNEAGKGNDIFTQAAKLTQDLSVRRGVDMKSAALWVGKALNDPAKGFARLQRVGVSFSKHQQDQIKVYDALGQRGEAQKVILAELQRVTGGAAAAYGKTLPGELGKAKLSFEEIGIVIGSFVAPYLAKAAAGVASFVDGMRKGTGPGGKFVGILKTMGGILKSVLGPPLSFVVDNIRTLGTLLAIGVGAWGAYKGAMIATRAIMITIEAIQFAAAFLAAADAIGVAGAAMIVFDAATFANPIGLVVIAIAALVAGFVLLGGKLSWITDAATTAWNAIRTGAMALFNWVRSNWPLLLIILTGPFGLVAQYVIRHFDEIVGFVSAMPGRIRAAASGMWDGIKDAFRSAINWVIGAWDSLHFKLGGWHIKGPFGVGVKIPTVTVGMPHIPTLATGGDVVTGGMAIVGERGPELIDLNAGARVAPLDSRPQKEIVKIVTVEGRVLAEAVFHAAQDMQART